jgi:hypothetical protein
VHRRKERGSAIGLPPNFDARDVALVWRRFLIRDAVNVDVNINPNFDRPDGRMERRRERPSTCRRRRRCAMEQIERVAVQNLAHVRIRTIDVVVTVKSSVAHDEHSLQL